MKAVILILSAIGVYLTLAILAGWESVVIVVFGITILFLLQGILTIWALLFTWSDPKRSFHALPPKEPKDGKRITFSILVPARHEEKVIGDTIKAMAKINYPKELYEVLVLVRADDTGTIEAVKTAITDIAQKSQNTNHKFQINSNNQILNSKDIENISLVVFDGGPVNKPRALNVGLSVAQNAYVGVFDAEDEPHPNILSKVEAMIMRKKADAVQGGVQIINVGSRWFTARNCLEYFFWFKSVLPFATKMGASPLGGNTVFFRSRYLQSLGGWDETALTEDADIGLRFSAAGYKIVTMYDEELSTREEAPTSLMAFVKQRSRWDQGFLQVALKADWARLPNLKQQFLNLYFLLQPIIRIVNVLGLFSIPYFTFVAHVPLWITLFSYIPLYFLTLSWGFDVVGLYTLKKRYNLAFSPSAYFGVVLLYFPYQILLAWSALRAIFRLALGELAWEKTAHFNVHRKFAASF